MEGASAAITFVQLGLSIATTLNTYIADVRHGRDDVANLANEIEATVSHAQDLDKLIQENKLTSRWSEHGLFLAQKCLTDCHDVIKRLSALLRRSGGTAPGMPVLNGADEVESNDTKSLISRTDIDMSNFNRLYWPLLKPQLQYLKQELQKIKIEILLAVNTYQVNATPKADERKAIAERIVALWRSRTVARRQLVVYGRELEAPYDDYYRQYTRAPKNEYTARGREETIPEPGSDPIDRPRRQERDVSPASFHRSPRRYTHRERSPDIFPDEKPHQNRDSYDYTYYPRPEANGLPFAPDLDPVNEKSTKRQVIDYVLGFVLAPGDDAAGTRQNVNELWDLYKHNPAALRSALGKIIKAAPVLSKTANSNANRNTLPLALQDPKSPNGTAFTWSLLISNRSPELTVEPFNYPLELLTKRLLKEERKARKSGTPGLQAYNTISTLPKRYQSMITRWLQPIRYSPYHWELLLLDPTYGSAAGSDSRRKRIMQKLSHSSTEPRRAMEPTSVLAVFKRCVRPDYDPRSRSRSSGYDEEERNAQRRRKMERLITLVAGALGAVAGKIQKKDDERSSSPRGRRRRRSFSPSVSRERRYNDDRWRPAQGPREPPSGKVYEMFETEEAGDGPDEDLAEKIVTEYTGSAARRKGRNGTRLNGVASENMSDTPTANGDTLF